MLKITFLVSACFMLAAAQKFGLGPCPNATSLPQLDASRYLGRWYEITKLPSFFERDQICVNANYSIKADGHIKVFNRGIKNGEVVSATGDAYVPDPSKPAELTVSFATGSPYAPYWVLDTDYTRYSVVYSCVSLEIAHVQFAWILSRTNTLDAGLRQAALQTLTTNGVDTSALVEMVQTNCTF